MLATSVCVPVLPQSMICRAKGSFSQWRTDQPVAQVHTSAQPNAASAQPNAAQPVSFAIRLPDLICRIVAANGRLCNCIAFLLPSGRWLFSFAPVLTEAPPALGGDHHHFPSPLSLCPLCPFRSFIGDVLPHFCFFVYPATDPTSECLELFRFAARGRGILNFVANGRQVPAQRQSGRPVRARVT